MVFLSDAWFQAVNELQQDYSAEQMPAELASVILNLVVQKEGDDTGLSLVNGRIVKGLHEKPDAELTLPENFARSLILKGNWSSAFSGYLAGQIKINGRLVKVMPIPGLEVTPSLRELQQKIDQISE